MAALDVEAVAAFDLGPARLTGGQNRLERPQGRKTEGRVQRLPNPRLAPNVVAKLHGAVDFSLPLLAEMAGGRHFNSPRIAHSWPPVA